MAKGMSGRAFANHMGLSETAIRNAEKEGKISRGPDGLYDPVSQAAAYRANTRADMQRNPPAQADASTPAPTQSPPPSTSPIPASRPVYDDEYDEDEDVSSITQAEANRRLSIQKLRKQQLENAALETLVIDRQLTLLMVETMARDLRETWLQFVDKAHANLASRIGSDRHATYVALRDLVAEHLTETVDKVSVMRYQGEINRATAKLRTK